MRAMNPTCTSADGQRRQQDGAQPAGRALDERDEAAGRQPAELDREDQDQDQAEPEFRRRQADQRDRHHRLIRPAIVVDGRDRSGRDPEDDRECQRESRKRERHRQALDQRGGDRAVEQDRLPEIAAQHAPVPVGHLQRQRLVEPERDAQARDLLGRGARVQEGRCRIARHQPDHGKRHQRHEQQDDRGAGEPPYQEASHSLSRSRMGVRLRASSPTCAESGTARSSSASTVAAWNTP